MGPINKLIDTVPFDMHCYSLDWHPSDHVSFIDNIHLRKLDSDSKVTLYLHKTSPHQDYRYKTPGLRSSTTQWSSLDHPKLNRSFGPGIVSRSPGGQSCIKISRLKMIITLMIMVIMYYLSRYIQKEELSTKESIQTLIVTQHSLTILNWGKHAWKNWSEMKAVQMSMFVV